MTIPTLEFAIEFDAGVWTDVSADLRSWTTRRGRNRELDQYETGRGTAVLSNAARLYDPEYAAGTYYGKLRPNRRVRIKATSGSTYPVMVGYIDRITQQYAPPNEATAVVEWSDLFKVLNRIELPRSAYTATVATSPSGAPEIWYRLDEPAGSMKAINSGTLGGAEEGEWITNPPNLGQAGLIVRDAGTSVATDPTGAPTALFIPADYSLDDTEPFAVEAWINVDVFTGLEHIVFQPGPGASGESVKIQLLGTGKVGFVIWHDAATAFAVETSFALTPGVTYHVVCRIDSSGAMYVFVNGVDATVADLGVPGTTSGATFSKTPGTNIWVANQNFGGLSSASVMDEIAIYKAATQALSNAEIADHFSAGRTPWIGDDPFDRATRVLNLGGIAAGDRDLDHTSLTTFQATSLGGTLLAYLQKIYDTENGHLFISRDGKATSIDRLRGWEDYLTPVETFGDGGGAEIGYTGLLFDVDHTAIVNRATVSRDGSVAVTYESAASEGEFQIIDLAKDGLFHDDDDYSLEYAQWIVNTHKDPQTRSQGLDVIPIGNPTVLYPAVLQLELYDRVTVKRRPQGVGSAISIDMRIDSISHAVDLQKAMWQTKFQLSRADPPGGQVGIWDTSKWDQAVWGF